jgi:hypothetical protein
VEEEVKLKSRSRRLSVPIAQEQESIHMECVLPVMFAVAEEWFWLKKERLKSVLIVKEREELLRANSPASSVMAKGLYEKARGD